MQTVSFPLCIIENVDALWTLQGSPNLAKLDQAQPLQEQQCHYMQQEDLAKGQRKDYRLSLFN